MNTRNLFKVFDEILLSPNIPILSPIYAADVKTTKLVKVDENTNKYCNIIEEPDEQSFRIEAGDIGSSPAVYFVDDISEYSSYVQKYLSEGYIDVSDVAVQDDSNLEIFDELIRVLYTFSLADPGIKSVKDITHSNYYYESMLDKAEDLLKTLADTAVPLNKDSAKDFLVLFNKALYEIYSYLPRLSSTYNIVPERKTFGKPFVKKISTIIEKEKEIVAEMREAFADTKKAAEIQAKYGVSPYIRPKNMPYLKDLGITIRAKDSQLESLVKSKLGSIASMYRNCWYIDNEKTKQEYDIDFHKHDYKDHARYDILWHGAKSKYWQNLITEEPQVPTGLPKGRMFGNGVYFTDKAPKAFSYTSGPSARWTAGSGSIQTNTCYLGLYTVRLGRAFKTNKYHYFYHHFNNATIWHKGHCDSLYAKADPKHKDFGKFLKDDEYVVYRKCQFTIYALVELWDEYDKNRGLIN